MTSSSFRSGNCSDDYQEESGVFDNLEARLSDALDQLTNKSARVRQYGFEFLIKNFSQRYMADFILKNKSKLKALSKLRSQDLSSAANLISIVCATIGPSPDTDPLFSELVSQLLAHLADQSAQPDVRAKCARTIAICTYIIGVGGYLEQIMEPLYAIFSASCAKGDGTMPNPSEKVAALHSACLQAWTLLLTAVNNSSPQVALEIVEEYMDKIVELLDSPHLDVKCSAGETVAVIIEIIKSQNEDLTPHDLGDLCDKIRDIMSDSQKSRAKRDLRQQRSNFREILAAIEEGEMPNLVIKFGKERLVLESWARRRLYDAFCEVFGTGLNHQLAENENIRDIFGLGSVMMPVDMPCVKRSDNSYENMLADKVRSKNMRRLRDKRADVID